MKKVSKVALSMLLVFTLLISNLSAFAATKSSETASEQPVAKNDITALENNLKTKNTDVISELNKQISNY